MPERLPSREKRGHEYRVTLAFKHGLLAKWPSVVWIGEDERNALGAYHAELGRWIEDEAAIVNLERRAVEDWQPWAQEPA